MSVIVELELLNLSTYLVCFSIPFSNISAVLRKLSTVHCEVEISVMHWRKNVYLMFM